MQGGATKGLRSAPPRARWVAAAAVGLALATATVGCSRDGSTATDASTTTSSDGVLRGKLYTAPSTTPPPTMATPPTTYVDDPKQPVPIVRGQTVAIKVQSDGSTKGWQVESYDQAHLFDVGAQPDAAKPDMVDLLFRGTESGTGTVVLRYGTMDQPSPTDQRVTFTIAVSP